MKDGSLHISKNDHFRNLVQRFDVTQEDLSFIKSSTSHEFVIDLMNREEKKLIKFEKFEGVFGK